ncbi:MAG: hypothetical protein QOD06_1725 [Candidatus Binatota bacterium]|nr:hypothetical protein [Candidatus Binatota bacterium]
MFTRSEAAFAVGRSALPPDRGEPILSFVLRTAAVFAALAFSSACAVPGPRPGPHPGSPRAEGAYPGGAEYDREYARLHSLAEARYREGLERVQRVGQRVLASMKDPPRIQFVIVRGDPSINAGATFGQVGVTDGMLKFIQSDDEMAVVLAHEIAHVEQGHVTKGMLSGLALNVLAIAVETQAPGAGRAVGGIGQLFLNRYTQSQEREADEVGLRHAYEAGYDPRAAVDVMERLAVETPETMSAEFFSTHPSSVERAIAARKEADELLANGPPPHRSEVLALERRAESSIESSTPEPQAERTSEERSSTFRHDELSDDSPYEPNRRTETEDEAPSPTSSSCRRARNYLEMARESGDPRERKELRRRALRFCPELADAHEARRRVTEDRGPRSADGDERGDGYGDRIDDTGEAPRY